MNLGRQVLLEGFFILKGEAFKRNKFPSNKGEREHRERDEEAQFFADTERTVVSQF